MRLLIGIDWLRRGVSQGVDDTARQHAAAPRRSCDSRRLAFAGCRDIASTIWLTFYRISAKRGSLRDNITDIVVHDHWKPYYTLAGVLHALCNAHHRRELQALIEIEHEDWARRMQTLLRRACHAANLARRLGKPVPSKLIALIERC